MEIWKKIEQSDLYEVSSIGNLRRLESIVRSSRGRTRIHKARMLKPSRTKNGYTLSRVWEDGKETQISTHVLVAKAFIPNPENKSDVNHKNGIRWDNRVENLEWCTPSENARHAIDVLGKDFATNRKRVLCITTGKEYESVAAAAKELKLNFAHIASVCRGIYKHHKRFVFKYI